MTEPESADDPPDLAPILYREFHDVPRLVVVFLGRRRVLLDCAFDDRAEDYVDHYDVYRLPDGFVPPEGGWESLATQTTGRLEAIPVRDVRFDPTKRRFVGREAIERCAGSGGI